MSIECEPFDLERENIALSFRRLHEGALAPISSDVDVVFRLIAFAAPTTCSAVDI
jgi:hypothetical protein